MNNKELQAARKLLFIDVKEAAEHIGGVSPRTWQYWEAGHPKVPADVSEKIHAVIDRRTAMIKTVNDLLAETNADEMMIDYYQSYKEYVADHFKATPIDWRLSQSVAAHFLTQGKCRLK